MMLVLLGLVPGVLFGLFAAVRHAARRREERRRLALDLAAYRYDVKEYHWPVRPNERKDS